MEQGRQKDELQDITLLEIKTIRMILIIDQMF